MLKVLPLTLFIAVSLTSVDAIADNAEGSLGYSIDQAFAAYNRGGWVGFSSLYKRYPRLSLSVVVFCNTSDASAPELGARVAELAVTAIIR